MNRANLIALFDAIRLLGKPSTVISLQDYTGEIVEALTVWARTHGCEHDWRTLESETIGKWQCHTAMGAWGEIIVHDNTTRTRKPAADSSWSPAHGANQ